MISQSVLKCLTIKDQFTFHVLAEAFWYHNRCERDHLPMNPPRGDFVKFSDLLVDCDIFAPSLNPSLELKPIKHLLRLLFTYVFEERILVDQQDALFLLRLFHFLPSLFRIHLLTLVRLFELFPTKVLLLLRLADNIVLNEVFCLLWLSTIIFSSRYSISNGLKSLFSPLFSLLEGQARVALVF